MSGAAQLRDLRLELVEEFRRIRLYDSVFLGPTLVAAVAVFHRTHPGLGWRCHDGELTPTCYRARDAFTFLSLETSRARRATPFAWWLFQTRFTVPVPSSSRV